MHTNHRADLLTTAPQRTAMLYPPRVGLRRSHGGRSGALAPWLGTSRYGLKQRAPAEPAVTVAADPASWPARSRRGAGAPRTSGAATSSDGALPGAAASGACARVAAPALSAGAPGRRGAGHAERVQRTGAFVWPRENRNRPDLTHRQSRLLGCSSVSDSARPKPAKRPGSSPQRWQSRRSVQHLESPSAAPWPRAIPRTCAWTATRKGDAARARTRR